MGNVIWEDLKFFLERLRVLPISESLELGNNGGFCVSTQCESENWVYFPEIVDEAEAKRAINFFSERKISFMWPIYDSGEKVLEAEGLLYAGKLEAMSLEPGEAKFTASNPSVKISPVNNSETWARVAWHSFGGGIDDTPANYYALVDALNNDWGNLALYLAELDGEPAGTFLITNEQNLMGVYYFAVVPEMRRKKIAASMMNEICRLAGEKKKKIVLQATPMGVKFYESFGFQSLFSMPVYSTESDIF